MNANSVVRIFAGTFILVSLALGVSADQFFAGANWLWFTAFVGANLVQSGFTQFCPLERILLKLGVRPA
jgi:hypothetical protein